MLSSSFRRKIYVGLAFEFMIIIGKNRCPAFDKDQKKNVGRRVLPLFLLIILNIIIKY
jgi:hypothetical protein